MKTFLALSYFLTWVTVPHLLLLKKRPAATLAWLWAILFIPFLGALVYCLFGTDRLKRRRLKHRLQFSARPSRYRRPHGATDESTERLVQTLPSRDRQFLQLLSRINQLPVSSTAESRILRNASEFYPALLQQIAQARHHIDLEFYLWRGDATGRDFLALLTAAAARGVKVRLLLDGVGSFGLRRARLRELRHAGGQFSWFQSLDPLRNRFLLNLRNHRKLQIIDHAVAFVGGMNIGREYEGLDPTWGQWQDVQVEVRGSVVQVLQEVFADDWFFATGQKLREPPAPLHPATDPVHVIVGGADRANEPLSKSIVSLLHEATAGAWIATGYFVPDDVLLAALEIAAARGVDVRLLVAGGDHPWLLVAGRSYYGELLNAGVRLFEYSTGVNHAKVMLVDSHWAMVGSANLDYRSMRLNFELNLLFRSPAHNASLTRILEDDFARSVEISPASFARRPLHHRWAEAALRPLSPML